ncbi:hypothetical protein ES332_A02G111500v1 [Gossypium tomentosum]|uniref:Uncharacterized protein n=1 Tax=Gossypium tomentosum TaxID=34277 RepID=A0A5D2RFS5_GOSTO|nr:hypothetical protein ES332_A02G111500v1 [Gossypium tomentosum]
MSLSLPPSLILQFTLLIQATEENTDFTKNIEILDASEQESIARMEINKADSTLDHVNILPGPLSLQLKKKKRGSKYNQISDYCSYLSCGLYIMLRSNISKIESLLFCSRGSLRPFFSLQVLVQLKLEKFP